MARLTPVAATALAVLLLAGCATALPEGPTEGEIRRYQQEELRNWWESMRPDQPMPTIEVVEYTDLESRDALASACVEERIGPPENVVDPDDFAEMDLAYWTCYAQYPLAPEYDPRLSDAQLDYSYAYFAERTVPCLEGLGYNLPPRAWTDLLAQTSDSAGYPMWNPYWDIWEFGRPEQDEIDTILDACPPPPFDYPWVG